MMYEACWKFGICNLLFDPRMWPLGHKVGLWNGFASVRLSVCPSVRLRSLISDIVFSRPANQNSCFFVTNYHWKIYNL